jgi:hypothetical protein
LQSRGYPSFFVLDDAPADPFGDLRDEGVSEGATAVQSVGNPMSHSRNVGFSGPRMALRPCDWRPDRRLAVGVGHLKWPLGLGLPRTAWIKSPLPPLSASVARGVGQSSRSIALTITVSDVIVLRGPPFIRAFIAM